MYAAVVEKMVEIRYAGVAVGKATAIRELDTRGVFLGLTEPLPSGTDVVLRVGGEDVPVRVATVVESADVAKAGMKVAFRVAGKAGLFGEPAQAGEPETATTPASAAVAAPVPSPVTESVASGAAASGPAHSSRDGEVVAVAPATASAGRDVSARAPAAEVVTAKPSSESSAPARPAAENHEPEASKKHKKSKRR